LDYVKCGKPKTGQVAKERGHSSRLCIQTKIED